MRRRSRRSSNSTPISAYTYKTGYTTNRPRKERAKRDGQKRRQTKTHSSESASCIMEEKRRIYIEERAREKQQTRPRKLDRYMYREGRTRTQKISKTTQQRRRWRRRRQPRPCRQRLPERSSSYTPPPRSCSPSYSPFSPLLLFFILLYIYLYLFIFLHVPFLSSSSAGQHLYPYTHQERSHLLDAAMLSSSSFYPTTTTTTSPFSYSRVLPLLFLSRLSPISEHRFSLFLFFFLSQSVQVFCDDSPPFFTLVFFARSSPLQSISARSLFSTSLLISFFHSLNE